jgi:hypothetical protein
MSNLTIVLNDKLKPTDVNEYAYTELRNKENARVDKFADWIREIEHEENLVEAQTANGLLNTFLTAYNNHKTLILRPDDIHIALQFIYTTIVNNNSEEMRHLFVDHKGKKNLISITDGDPDFHFFAQDFREQMQNNIKVPEFIDMLNTTYSTTTPLISSVSNMLAMDTLKAYFSFTCVCSCGIPAVQMEGSIEDWEILFQKYHDSKKFFTGIQKKVDVWYSKMDSLIDMFLYMRKLGTSGTVNASSYICERWAYIISTERVGSGGDVAYGGLVSLLFPFDSRKSMQHFDSFPMFFTNDETKHDGDKLLKFTGRRMLTEFQSSLTETDAKMICYGDEFPIKFCAGFSTFVHHNKDDNTVSTNYVYRIQKENEERKEIMGDYKQKGYYIDDKKSWKSLMAPQSDVYNLERNLHEVMALFEVNSMNYYEDEHFSKFKTEEIDRLNKRGIHYDNLEEDLYAPESEKEWCEKNLRALEKIYGEDIYYPKYYESKN